MQLQWTHAHSVSVYAEHYLEADQCCADYVCEHVKNTSLQKISDNFVYYVTVHCCMLCTIHTALKRAAPLAELAIMMCSQVN